MSALLIQVWAFLRRHMFPSICALVTIACGIGAWYLWGVKQDLEVIHADKAKEGEAMLTLLVGGSTQRQELANVKATTKRIEENLVVEENLAENYWYFLKFEEQTKARLPELHQLSSPINDPSPLFKRVPYTMRISGSYEQVGAFLLALETGPRLVNITGFNFSRREPNGANLALDLNLELLGKK